MSAPDGPRQPEPPSETDAPSGPDGSSGPQDALRRLEECREAADAAYEAARADVFDRHPDGLPPREQLTAAQRAALDRLESAEDAVRRARADLHGTQPRPRLLGTWSLPAVVLVGLAAACCLLVATDAAVPA